METKKLREGYCLIIDALFEGRVPLEYDEYNAPILYETRREAELQIIEALEDRILDYKEGDRDFDDAVCIEEHIEKVVELPDGSLRDECGQIYDISHRRRSG